MKDLTCFGQEYVMSCNSSGWPKSFGIYLILDRKTGRINVGATQRTFQARWRDHRCDLRAGRHRNCILQRSYNRDSEDNFIMMVVEVIENKDSKAILSRENFWIDELKSRVENGGFNLKDGDAIHLMSDVTREVMRSIAYARKNYQYIFKDPSGEIVEPDRLDLFCKKHSLNESCMRSVFAGEKKSHKGYTRIDSKDVPLCNRYAIVIDPSGLEHKVTNITQFALKHDLVPSSLRSIIIKKSSQYKGWRLKESNIVPPNRPSRVERGLSFPAQKYRFKDPSGKIIDIPDLTQFCFKLGLNRKVMAEVFMGRKKSYKGYTSVTSNFIPLCLKKTIFIGPNGKEYETSNITAFAREHGLSPVSMSQLARGVISTVDKKRWRLKK